MREVIECNVFGSLQEINLKWFERGNVSMDIDEVDDKIFVRANLFHTSKPYHTNLTNIEFCEIIKSSKKKLIVGIYLENTEIDSTDEDDKWGINKNYFTFNELKLVDEAVKTLAEML